MRRIHAGATQHQAAETGDETGLLRHWNEFGGRDHATIGVRPANEGLEAGITSAREIDQRLVVRAPHLVLDRNAQIEFDLAALLGTGVHLVFEESKGAAR